MNSQNNYKLYFPGEMKTDAISLQSVRFVLKPSIVNEAPFITVEDFYFIISE